MDKIMGELTFIKICKYLKEGLTDKSEEEFLHFRHVNANKAEVECDCCVCFSSINKDTNPIVYCSGKKYLSIIQLHGGLPPGLLSSKTAPRRRLLLLGLSGAQEKR